MSRQVERARSVAGCVTHARLLAGPAAMGAADNDALVLAFPGAAPVRARGALNGATIRARMLVSDGAAGDVIIHEYRYALHDRLDVELLAWHWHPNPVVPAPASPHVHVSAALRPATASGERGMVPLDKRHLPTGMVSLAAFVRMLIEEFGVEPLARDWQVRLAER